MPTYEYQCPAGHRFELFQKMSEEPRAPCPECGAESERVISGGAGFLFRGDGFYITDYRSESYKKEASKETSPGAESQGNKEKKDATEKSTPKPSSPPKTSGGGTSGES
jgi:putative FmdB family regulatory protein